MTTIVPCLWLDDQAQEAADFYTGVFPDARIIATSHYPKGSTNPSGKPPGSVLTVEFELAGQPFTALNGGPHFTMNPSISFFVHTRSVEQTDRIVAALVEGGSFLMALDAYPWSERYAWVQDRFGASWQVILAPDEPLGARPVPFLMFANDQQGRAGEAMDLYTEAFGGKVKIADRFAAGEGPEESIKHGRMSLGTQDLIVMDSPIRHQFDFNEGISLQVICDDQAGVDHFWDVLRGGGGEEGPCGWLKDRFGVSWQVVPAGFIEMVKSGDEAAMERAFNAMLSMKKLDLSVMQEAYAG